MSTEKKPQVNLGGMQLSEGRMPCPNCSAPMVIPFTSLLAGRPIWCSTCGACLTINTEASGEALCALRAAQEKLEQIRGTAASE